MDYIREAEKYLKHYRDLHLSLDRMAMERGRLISQAGPAGYKKQTLDPTGVIGGQTDSLMNVLFKIQTLTDSINQTKQKLKEIDEILNCISRGEGNELYGPVLRMWYIDRLPKEAIAEEVGYSSRRSIYTIRDQAIRLFAVRLFGLAALEVM